MFEYGKYAKDEGIEYCTSHALTFSHVTDAYFSGVVKIKYWKEVINSDEIFEDYFSFPFIYSWN